MTKITFKEIESLRVLKRFQQDLSLLTGLSFDFVDLQVKHSLHLNTFQKYARLCRFVNSSPTCRNGCQECTFKAVNECLKRKETVIYDCHLGLIDVYIPLIMHDSVIGVLSTGQFLFSKPTANSFKKIERKLAGFGLSIARAKKYYFTAPIIEKDRVKAIVDLINMVIEYIIETENKILASEEASRQEKINRAWELIESRYAEDISLADAAAAVSLSPSRLAHLFKERLNTSFTSYINDLRIHWAKFFLTNTNLKVINIAYRVGFKNLSHFNHLFKKKMGLSPLQFRKQQNSTRI